MRRANGSPSSTTPHFSASTDSRSSPMSEPQKKNQQAKFLLLLAIFAGAGFALLQIPLPERAASVAKTTPVPTTGQQPQQAAPQIVYGHGSPPTSTHTPPAQTVYTPEKSLALPAVIV